VGLPVGLFNDLSIREPIRGFIVESVCEYAHVYYHESVALSLGWSVGAFPMGPVLGHRPWRCFRTGLLFRISDFLLTFK